MDPKIYDSLLKIGQRLFAENDMANLCEMIIDEAQNVTFAEGGTLYLVDHQPPTKLNFTIVHNKALDKVDTQDGTRISTLKPIPLFETNGDANLGHIAACAANTRKIINIEDTYASEEFDFSGAHQFDKDEGYRTQSILAVPLINNLSELVGVLQLINARTEDLSKVTLFEKEIEPIVATFASFAALAINSQNMSNSNKELLIKLSGQSNTQLLMESILTEAQDLTRADGGSLYLRSGEDNDPQLEFMVIKNDTLKLNFGGASGEPMPFKPIALFDEVDGRKVPNQKNVVTYCANQRKEVVIDDAYTSQKFDFSGTRDFDEKTGYVSKSFLTVPLLDHSKELIGVLQLVNAKDPFTHEVCAFSANVVPLVKALATYASIALENQLLVHELKELLDTFIQCIAKAIDAKSSHTSGHCQRVPLLTKLMARAACEDQSNFATFNLDDDGWYELHVAAWLHDCGKLATPDSVLDKSTKLHGLKDGIHTVNARFTALKAQTENQFLQKIVEQPSNKVTLENELNNKLAEIEQDRLFVEKANKGGEFFSDEDVKRVEAIAKKTWKDHNNELQTLLSPEEVYHLSISRGTLTTEERNVINNHISVTIDMLESLKFPRKLSRVPEYAGGHHEKMNGTGFPKGLTGDQMSIPARIMAIADIFEALTAQDRPYKDPMKMSQALSIMKRMKEDGHIDPELFDLFLSARIWEEYAKRELNDEQLDISDPKPFF